MRKIQKFKVYWIGAFVIVSLLLPISVFVAQDSSEPEASTVAIDRDGFEMVYVPSGTVEMGIKRQVLNDLIENRIFTENATDQKDRIMSNFEGQGVFDTVSITISGFWIDKYEVTIEQYQSIYFMDTCIGTGRCSAIDLSYAPELMVDTQQPQVGVSWFEAFYFCMARGARLPTESEWEYAASGPENLFFPWGDTLSLDNLSLNNSTYPVGSKPENVSWVGAYDMVGNAGEWVEDRIKSYIPQGRVFSFLNSQLDIFRVIRGGSYRKIILDMTTFARDAEHPVTSGGQGVRCARSSDPRQ